MANRKEIFTELEHEVTYYSAHTKNQYFSHVSDYLDFVGERDWQDRGLLYEYIELLRKRKLSQSTINYIVRGPIGAIFRMYGLRLPVKLPRVSVRMIDLSSLIAFDEDEIKKFIQVAIASNNPQWQNILALATVYGLRAGEIKGIRKEDTHPIKKTIRVRTLKGGMLREHLVPNEIQPYLFNYDYPLITDNQMYVIFKAIADAAGFEQIPRKCYHAIRHGVVTTLDEMRDNHGQRVLAQDDVFRFTRWSGGSIMRVYVTPREFAVDQRIFAKHPFLKYWE